MGKVISVMWKPFRDYNLESRAHKIISRDKPTAAPKHQKDKLDYERILKEHPEVLQQSLKKDSKLDNYLKNVYVTSKDPMPHTPQASSSADRPLPLNRKHVANFEFGFPEPEKVPYGRVTLRSALKFITDHQKDRVGNSIDNIAEEYKLPNETVSNIIKYFKVYEVYMPTEKKVKANFMGPVVPRRKVITHKPKELSTGDKKEDT